MIKTEWPPASCHVGPVCHCVPLARENIEHLVCWASGPATVQVECINTLCYNLFASVLGAILVLGALETLETIPTALEEQLVTLIVCFLEKSIYISIPLRV